MSEQNGVRHPILSRVVDEAFEAIDGLKSQKIDRFDSNALSSQLGRVVSAVNSDIKHRLMAPKIARFEAAQDAAKNTEPA